MRLFFLEIFIKRIKKEIVLFLPIFRAYPTDGEGFSLWFYVKSWFIEKKIMFKHVLYASVPSDDPPPAKLPLMLLDFFFYQNKTKKKKWKSEKAALLEFSQNMNPSFQCKIDLSFDTLSIHEDTFMLYTYDVHKVCSKKMCGKTFLLPMIEDLRRYL